MSDGLALQLYTTPHKFLVGPNTELLRNQHQTEAEWMDISFSSTGTNEAYARKRPIMHDNPESANGSSTAISATCIVICGVVTRKFNERQCECIAATANIAYVGKTLDQCALSSNYHKKTVCST